METEFTPFLSLGGGILIGFSALILMMTNGRIAGISGIVSRVLPPSIDKKGLPQGVVFIVGLLLAAPLYYLVSGLQPIVSVSDNYLLLSVAGLLVGFGAVLGNGCTSGHGVCGVSRLSRRSIVATITFMISAFIVVFILRHVVGG